MTTLDLNDYLNDYVSTPDLTRAATLPSRWYTDPEFLQLEKERIFWKIRNSSKRLIRTGWKSWTERRIRIRFHRK